MIKTGCSGFPVGRKNYTSKLALVELKDLFEKFPLNRTVEKWSKEKPGGFEYVVCVNKAVTHPAKSFSTPNGRSHKIGFFQDTPEVHQAFRRSVKTANALNAKILYFQLPGHFGPTPDNIGRMQAFFRKFDISGLKGSLHIVWEPPKGWGHKIINTLSSAMNITPSTNPLGGRPPFVGPIRYFKVGTSTKTKGVHQFSADELRAIKKACDKPLSYVIFNNGPTAFYDAVKFSSMATDFHV